MTLASIANELQGLLTDVESISGKYAHLSTDEERIQFNYDLFREELSKLLFKRSGKCTEKSRELRETGNGHFRKNDLWKAVNTYTESIAYAPIGSDELSLAFGNRAAALLHLHLTKEALEDVDEALKHTTDCCFRSKMLERKEKCLKLSVSSKKVENDFEAVELESKNELLHSASSIIDMRDDDIFGRSLVVTSDVGTGEVLIVEKPFSSIVVPNHFYTHCSGCFKRSFNLTPCSGCVTSMYCSSQCENATKEYHKIQCEVLSILTKLNATTFELLSVKILTDASQQVGSLEQLFKEISQYDKNNNKQTYNSRDHINVYKLVGNTEKRSISDLFHKSMISCIIVNILEKYSTLFNLYSGEKKEELIVLVGALILRYLQSMPCNAHEISEYSDFDNDEIGAGVYSTLSLINHSCDPNVVRHCYGDSIVLRAIRPIKKDEQLFDNYGYHYAVLPLCERQSSLFQQYYFQCNCEACLKKWPLQQYLPDERTNPVFKSDIDIEKYKLLTINFKKHIENIFQGHCESHVVADLMEYLDFLDEYVERPWKDYNICQEAIKHCLGLKGNCFRISKGIETCNKDSHYSEVMSTR